MGCYPDAIQVALSSCDFVGSHCPCGLIRHLSFGRSPAAAPSRHRCRDGRIRVRILTCCVIPRLGCRQPSLPRHNATGRCRDPLFARWNIRCSDIHFLQERGAHYGFCAIPGQAPFRRRAGKRAAIACAGGSKSHGRNGCFDPALGSGLPTVNRCIARRRNRCGDPSTGCTFVESTNCTGL